MSLTIEWVKGFWPRVIGFSVAFIIVIISLMYMTFVPSVTLEEANANVEGEDYRFRIIQDRHHDKANDYALYMPQMLLGGEWHNMEDRWTTNRSEAKDTINTELKKEEVRRLPRYVIVDTH